MNNEASTLARRNVVDIGFRYGVIPVFCVMMISPLLALPFILRGIYLQKNSAFLLFSLFLGLLAWLQVPVEDLYRHTLQYYNYLGKDFQYVINDPIYPDYISAVGKWILVNNGLSYQWYRLFWVAESFFVLAYALNDYIKSSEIYSRKEAFKRFIILYLFFEFIQTTSGVRYCCACYNYVFALYLIFNKKKFFIGFIFLWLSMRIHTSFIFFVPLSFLLYFSVRSKKIGVIGTIFGFIVIGILLSTYGEMLLGRRVDFYFSNGISGKGGATLVGFILFLFIRVTLIPFAYLGVKFFRIDKPWSRITMVWTIIMCLFLTNQVMIFRCAVILAAVGIYMLIESEIRGLVKRHIINIVIWSGILLTAANALNYRNIIFNSRFELICAPVFVIQQIDYDKHWLQENIRYDKLKKHRQIF